MTPIDLLTSLKTFIEECTKDIILQTRATKGEQKQRAAEVHLMKLPDVEAETKKIPYILLQLLTGQDEEDKGEPRSSECKIRVIVATYSEDGGEGALDVLNVITRIRMKLLKESVVAERYILKMPLEYMVYPEDTAPYHLGEMMLIFSIPAIEREVQVIWQ